MLTEGEYDCTVVSCEAGSSFVKKTPYLQVNLSSPLGEVPPATIYFSRKNTGRVQSTMEALGWQNGNTSQLCETPCPIAGVEVKVYVYLDYYKPDDPKLRSDIMIEGGTGEADFNEMDKILSGKSSEEWDEGETKTPDDDAPF